MRRNLSRSNAHFKKAVSKLPLGVTSNFRYWGEDKTIYVKSGKGGRITDIDNNSYVDYRLGYGPAILGYANPEVDAAAIEGMKIGGVFALATEREYELACRISKMMPAAELVRFSNSGTEATMAALRIARGVTGRDDYILVEGGYHGLYDAALWLAKMEEWDQKSEPEIGPYSKGVPMITGSLAHFVQMNDANGLEDTMKKYRGKIAAMLFEPMMGNCLGIAADPEFVKAARELCTKYDILLIIDEVKTGFRVAKGGCQELYGVKADITTMAKAVANGYPISVVAGREDVMRHVGKGIAHGGTYTAHSVSLAAACKTLQILDETDALARVAAYGKRIRQATSDVLKSRGIAHSYVGHDAMLGIFFDAKPPKTYRAWKSSNYSFYDAMSQVLIDHGVLVEPDSREPWFMSAAHDDGCFDDTMKAFAIAVDETIANIKSGKVDAHAH
ncbi:MAG: aminotransferase class III-fold pyridoxal phosphate-dependent enzyme [Candidatus Symbiobacter sp.]|nr:aminotransferase class III-fold pyridoxal phosphate-dependent enzyme [Candidatus Symbiobacter sp.]